MLGSVLGGGSVCPLSMVMTYLTKCADKIPA
jgi:hypothetical protein